MNENEKAEQIRRRIEEAIRKGIGDFREHLGLPRDRLTEWEKERLKYCPECNRPYEDEEPKP